MPPEPASKRVSFGQFELDSQSCELRRDGLRLKITGQPLQLLELLLERPGSMVTREELRERLWSADTFVDFEHSLNTAIKRLRRVLDDDSEHPRYVETVPRRGYRFIAEIEIKPAEHPAASPQLAIGLNQIGPILPVLPESLLGRNRVKIRIWRSAIVPILVLFGLGVWMIVKLARRPAHQTTSIAVLPFVNETGDDRLDYVSDGLADDVIDELSKLHGFDVIAWSLASRYRLKDPLVAGQELKVGAVLTGTITRNGNRVFVRSELLDPMTRRHLWGEEYTRNLADLRSLEFEIASDIARRSGIQLSDTEKQQLSKQHTVDPEAYQLYLQGRFYSAKGTKEGLAKGLRFLQQATEKDPNYALAYSGLAYYYFMAMDWIMPPREAHEKSRIAAEKALSLDNSLAEAHMMLGIVNWLNDWKWDAAENQFRRALELSPSYPPAHQFYGFFLASLGREDEAIAEARHALVLDPLSLELNNALGQVLARGRRTQESVEQQQKAVDLDPNFWFSHLGLGMSYLQAGTFPKAIAELDKAYRLEPNSDVLGALGLAYGLSGDRDSGRRTLATLSQTSATSYVPPYDFAQIYIGLGDRGKAFEQLTKSREERGFAVVWLNVSSDVDSLRSDSRFKPLLAPIGFLEMVPPPAAGSSFRPH